LILKGRRKDVIIRGGQNIYPLEIENLLLKHPKVDKVAAIGIPDCEMGEKACVYIVPKSGEEISFSEMVLFLKDQGIASFKIPERLEFIEDLPLAGGIKVDKKLLRQDIENKLKREVVTFSGET
jgi:non-ribosomal peptide synthetase component E (peptide arylation enzyme)